MWSPDGGDPSKHVVERAGVPSGLDLTGLSWIEVDGVTIESGRVTMTNATHCKLDGVRVIYGRPGPESGFGGGGQVVVSGSDNEIVRSEIGWAPGRCVALGGTRNALRASIVHHCDAIGTYAQIVQLGGKQDVIEDCSLHDTGRDGIGTAGGGAVDGSIVAHNEIYDTGLIAKDTGGFYTYKTDGGGTILRWNVVHGVRPAPTLAYGGAVMGLGIYFDDGSSGWVAHHNVVWDVGFEGIFLHQPSRNVLAYNNTVVGSGDGATSGSAIATAPGGLGPDATGAALVNNLAVLLDDRTGWCIDISGATPTHDHNGYFQASGKGRNDSLGVEATGVVVAGITDGYKGAAPDIGAYEYGGTEKPGPRVTPGPPSPIVPDAGADGDVGVNDAARDSSPTMDGSNDGATSDTTIDDASAPSDAGSSSSGGCGCRLSAPFRVGSSSSLLLASLAVSVLRRRRRHTSATSLQ